MVRFPNRSQAVLAAVMAFATSAAAPALADAGHGKGPSIGTPGVAAKANRTIEITVGDNFYEPAKIAVKKGETIRFVIRNGGELLHEFNIGTPAMHAEHQKEMAMMVEQIGRASCRERVCQYV